MEMSLSSFAYAGKRLDSLAVLKLRKDGTTTERLVLAESPEKIEPGQYVWTDAYGGAVSPTTDIDSSERYRISVAIEDNGDDGLDWDPAPGSIVDPMLITATKSPDGPNDPDDPDDVPYSESGGGCDAGAGLYGAAFLALALAMRRRKAA